MYIDLIVTNTTFLKKYRKLSPDSFDTLKSQSGQNLIKLQDLLQTFLFEMPIFELKINYKILKANVIENIERVMTL